MQVRLWSSAQLLQRVPQKFTWVPQSVMHSFGFGVRHSSQSLRPLPVTACAPQSWQARTFIPPGRFRGRPT